MSTSYSLSGSNAGNGPGGRAFPDVKLSYEFSLRTAEITSSIETAACRHETTPGQWRVLARVNCSAFGGEGKPDRVRKSRIFNYLGYILSDRRRRMRRIRHHFPRAQAAVPSAFWDAAGAR